MGVKSGRLKQAAHLPEELNMEFLDVSPENW